MDASEPAAHSTPMLLTREEMSFGFGEDRFRLPRDRALLGWVLDQFLYGEVTGIQCGHWLYRAPSLEAASFFARQAVEELSHVRQFLRIYELVGVRPGPAHPVVRFLATGSMGQDYAEHVATEMAIGEGLVLSVFYALMDTVDDARVVKILEAAARREERHVAFGEQQTRELIEAEKQRDRHGLRDRLLGLNVVTLYAMRRLARAIQRKLDRDHEVMRHVPAFVEHLASNVELRLQRMGILEGSLSAMSVSRRLWLAASGYGRHWALLMKPTPALLTKTYLRDPLLLRSHQ